MILESAKIVSEKPASLANLSELFPFLNSIGASPKKGLSQNFLIDANIIRKIADAADIQSGETILEIGPGPGALTQELLYRKARVIAVEKDSLFAKALSRFEGDLTVHEADILEFPLESIPTPFKVVANLPYHITTPILEKLCKYSPTLALLMVQKEMGARMVAKSGTREISSFSIFLQTFAKLSIAAKVSRNCFYPAPSVDSSVIKLEFRPPALEDPTPFLIWMRQAFGQRRKMLRSTLGIKIMPYAELRPEALSLQEWLDLWAIAAPRDC